VRDNAAAFGGDPGNVTVFGESAGSMSVCTLMSMNSANGLFHRAIAESGAVNTIRSIEYASEVTNKFMSMAGVTDMVGLRSLTTEQIVKAQGDLMAGQFQADTLFGPVVDGTVLPEPPLHAIASGSAKSVDFLTGTNLDEVRLWAFYIPGLLDIPIQTAMQYMPMLSKSLGAYVDRTAASYKSRRPGATDGDITMAIGTDVIFRVPAIRVVEAQSALQPKTYMYLFTWPTPVQGGQYGSCHSLELFFVLDRLHAGDSVAVLGNNPPQKLADIMQDTWIAFAKTGNPNNKSISNWPAYNTSTRATMILNANPLVQNDPYSQDRQLWNRIPFDSVTPSPSF
jgi:para-nitrobenzyl esterase